MATLISGINVQVGGGSGSGVGFSCLLIRVRTHPNRHLDELDVSLSDSYIPSSE
jgi:hypothetical protein